jgi:hypothetical protein
MKKLGIAAFVVFCAIVLVFVLFTFVKCDGSKPVNYLSQLHMLIAPAKDTNPDWAKIRDTVKNRCQNLCDLRIFEVVEDRYAVIELSGAKDPNMVASMIMIKGDAKILTESGDRIASEKEVKTAGLLVPQNNEPGNIFGIEIDETATERLGKMLDALAKGKKLAVYLFIDDIKTLRAELTSADKGSLVVFKVSNDIQSQLLDYIGQAISFNMPYRMAVDRNNSFFIPPQSERPALLDFQDIIGKILVKIK